jgi:hypothetical protein
MDTVHSFRSTRARTVYLIPLYSTGSPQRAARTSAHTIARNWLEKGKGLVFDGSGRRKRALATAHAAAGTLSSLPPLLRSCFMSPIALVMASASRRLRGGLSGLGVPPFSVEHAALVLHDATFLCAGPPRVPRGLSGADHQHYNCSAGATGLRAASNSCSGLHVVARLLGL